MKRLFVSLVTLATFLFFFVSCYYDNEEALYPTLVSSCDTTNVTFSGTIAPMLSNNCYSCHSNTTAGAGGGVRLQAVADVISNAAKIDAAIKHTGLFPMPPSGKLSSCSISQFDIWVKKGMPTN